MRHLTSEGLKGRGMASTSCPRSWVQYSNTRNMLHGTLMSMHRIAATHAAKARMLHGCCTANARIHMAPSAMPIWVP